jgi:hypothetical protein
MRRLATTALLLTLVLTLTGCGILTGPQRIEWTYHEPQEGVSSLSTLSLEPQQTAGSGDVAYGYTYGRNGLLGLPSMDFELANGATATWEIADATLGDLTPDQASPRANLALEQGGATQVTATTSDGTTVTLDVVVFDGELLDNNQPGAPNPEAARGYFGYDVSAGSPTLTQAEADANADIYIASDGSLIVPSGAVLTSAANLQEAAPVADFTGAITELASPSFPPQVVQAGIYVIQTREGGQAAVQFDASWYASSEGFRGFPVGIRPLD